MTLIFISYWGLVTWLLRGRMHDSVRPVGIIQFFNYKTCKFLAVQCSSQLCLSKAMSCRRSRRQSVYGRQLKSPSDYNRRETKVDSLLRFYLNWNEMQMNGGRRNGWRPFVRASLQRDALKERQSGEARDSGGFSPLRASCALWRILVLPIRIMFALNLDWLLGL